MELPLVENRSERRVMAVLIFLFVLPTLLLFCPAYGKGTKYIDARRNQHKAVREYRTYINSIARRQFARARVIILVDSSQGFDVGTLRLNRTKYLDIKVTIYLYRGANPKLININVFELNNRNIVYKINQELNIRG